MSSGSAWWLVIEVRLDRQAQQAQPVGEVVLPHRLFHSKSFSPPQMSLTSTSSRPCSASMRCDERRDLLGLEVVDLHGDARRRPPR